MVEKEKDMDMEGEGRVRRMKEMCAGVGAGGFKGSKKGEQGKQDLLSYRSVLSFFTTSSNIYNATGKQ